MATYTYPVIVIEVPHQRPATGWTAHSAAELIEGCYASYANGNDEVSSVASIREMAGEDPDGWEGHLEAVRELANDQWVYGNVDNGFEAYDSEEDASLAALGHDLSGLLVLTPAEAREWLTVQRERAPHQYAEICAAITEELERIGG